MNQNLQLFGQRTMSNRCPKQEKYFDFFFPALKIIIPSCLMQNREQRLLLQTSRTIYISERLILSFSWNPPLQSPEHSHLHVPYYSQIAIVICVNDLEIIEGSLFLLKQEVIAFCSILVFINHEQKGKRQKIKVTDFCIEELSVSMIYITVLLLKRYQMMSVK